MQLLLSVCWKTAEKHYFDVIILDCQNTGRCKYQTKMRDDPERVMVFSDLRPGTEYIAQLVTVSSTDMWSEPRTLAFTTGRGNLEHLSSQRVWGT